MSKCNKPYLRALLKLIINTLHVVFFYKSKLKNNNLWFQEGLHAGFVIFGQSQAVSVLSYPRLSQPPGGCGFIPYTASALKSFHLTLDKKSTNAFPNVTLTDWTVLTSMTTLSTSRLNHSRPALFIRVLWQIKKRLGSWRWLHVITLLRLSGQSVFLTLWFVFVQLSAKRQFKEVLAYGLSLPICYSKQPKTNNKDCFPRLWERDQNLVSPFGGEETQDAGCIF